MGSISNLSFAVPKDDVLTSGEQVMVGVFAGLYGLSFLVALFLSWSILRTSKFVVNLILFFFVLAVFLFRCVYLSVYVSGGFRVEGMDSFVLVEPPSFFILSVASILIMSYGFCVYCLNHSVPQEAIMGKFWMLWVTFTVLLYLTLAVVLVLLGTLNTSDSITSECYGRMVTLQSNFTVQAIRIAYHSFLFVLAVIAALVLNLLGRQLRSNLRSDSLLVLSVISGVSVLSTNTLWVVYSALSGSSPYFVIPLWVCEALPLLLICWLVRPSHTEKGTDSTNEHGSSVQSVNSLW